MGQTACKIPYCVVIFNVSLAVSNLILHLSTAILQAILTSRALTSLDSIRSNSARRDELLSVKMIDEIVRIALVSCYSKVARPVILQPMHSLLNEIMTVHHCIIMFEMNSPPSRREFNLLQIVSFTQNKLGD